MRIHQNFIENLPLNTMFSLVAGLYFPKVVFVTTALILIGRIGYLIGYRIDPPKRIAGSAIALLANLTNLVLSVVTMVHFIKLMN